MRCYRENDRWLLPVAMRAVSSHNLESRHSDRDENDVALDPRLTSHEIADSIAMQLGGSFRVTTLGKIPSIINEAWNRTRCIQRQVHSSTVGYEIIYTV